MSQVTLGDKSYSDAIEKKFEHLEKAVSIISRCPRCSELFKVAIKEGQTPTTASKPNADDDNANTHDTEQGISECYNHLEGDYNHY